MRNDRHSLRWAPVVAVGISLISSALISSALMTGTAWSDEPRAPRPEFSEDQIKGISLTSLKMRSQEIGLRVSSLRKSAQQTQTQQVSGSSSDTAKAATATEQKRDRWSSLISAASIEDEIKIVRLRYDALITSQGKFVSGGYQTARMELSVLATLFAIITEYGGDIRWKSQAVAARDLLARTAAHCSEGSPQVFQEAKLRKADLQDWVSGTGRSQRGDESANAWSTIADRTPLMEYAELLIDALQDDGRDAKTIAANVDDIRRRCELLAMLGEVFAQEGLEGAGDEDYEKLSRDMMRSSLDVVLAIDRNNPQAIRSGISMIRSRCDACHADYR